jgi:polyhydroxybutyrate depolymerase
MPLVLVFHGGGGQPTQARFDTGMDEVADKHGFIVVYPAGTGRFRDALLTWNAGAGAIGYAAEHRVDDIGFTERLLDDVGRFFCIDRERVYATGLSNGAQMVYSLACALSERIAAIAPVSAPMAPIECRPGRAVPIMHFHGTADRHVPFEGGIGPAGVTGYTHLSVAENIGFWLENNGCSGTPRVRQAGAATFETYGPCAQDSEVVLVTLEGAGHTWPGGSDECETDSEALGSTNRDISASEEMWAFFARHSLADGA